MHENERIWTEGARVTSTPLDLQLRLNDINVEKKILRNLDILRRNTDTLRRLYIEVTTGLLRKDYMSLYILNTPHCGCQ